MGDDRAAENESPGIGIQDNQGSPGQVAQGRQIAWFDAGWLHIVVAVSELGQGARGHVTVKRICICRRITTGLILTPIGSPPELVVFPLRDY